MNTPYENGSGNGDTQVRDRHCTLSFELDSGHVWVPQFCSEDRKILLEHGVPMNNSEHLRWLDRTPAPAPATLPLRRHKTTFDEFNLPAALLQNINSHGINSCTPVQSRALPESLQGRDLVVSAPADSGKTIIGLISILAIHANQANARAADTKPSQALLIVASPEQAMRSGAAARRLAQSMDLEIRTLVHDVPDSHERSDTHRSPSLFIGTVDSVLQELANSSSDSPDKERIATLVIDEFALISTADLERLTSGLAPATTRQTLLLLDIAAEEEATAAAAITQLTHDPIRITMDSQAAFAPRETTIHVGYTVAAEAKFNLLYNLIHTQKLHGVLICVNHWQTSRDLQEKLTKLGIDCARLREDVRPERRLRMMNRFQQGHIQALLAIDPALEDLVLKNVSCVINHDLPEDPQDYSRRLEHLANGKHPRYSINFICEESGFQVPVIERLIKDKLECIPPSEELLQSPAMQGSGMQDKPAWQRTRQDRRQPRNRHSTTRSRQNRTLRWKSG